MGDKQLEALARVRAMLDLATKLMQLLERDAVGDNREAIADAAHYFRLARRCLADVQEAG